MLQERESFLHGVDGDGDARRDIPLLKTLLPLLHGGRDGVAMLGEVILYGVKGYGIH